MKKFEIQKDPSTGDKFFYVPYKGRELIEDPIYNKGSAFPEEERDRLNLHGIVPHHSSTITQQLKRTYENFSMKPNPIEKYIYLLGLLDRNETLFYRLVMEHLEEMLPIVYTPTVGEAAETYSHLFRRPRGIYISADRISQINKLLSTVCFSNIKLIVITDGERILGLGDQGVGGMAIPVGKVSLYVAGAGIHPTLILPILLDVGTNNEKLLEDPLYLGLRHKRLTGEDYDKVVEKMVKGVKRHFLHVLLQWEDFGKNHALKLLNKYRRRIRSFNDDIQGTGAVTFAALYSALRAKGEKLKDQRFVFFGFGQAGYGIARVIIQGLIEEGLTEKEAKELIYPVASKGLVMEDMNPHEYQEPFARKRKDISGWKIQNKQKISLLDTVRNSKSTVLIGVSGIRDAFTQDILKEMAKNTERPIIFALSNPTKKSECNPEDVYKATQGKALIATGSPFPPVKYKGIEHKVTQCNNMYIFPGVGLGTIISMTPQITDKMFTSAAKALASMINSEEISKGTFLPELKNIREVSKNVTFAVVKEAQDSGFGVNMPDEKLMEMIENSMWWPKYVSYRYKEK